MSDPVKLKIQQESEDSKIRKTPTSFLEGAGLSGQEGELVIDIYQTETELIIQSAIAGIKPEDLDVTIERDLITIRGNRKEPQAGDEDKSSSSPLADARVRDYFIQECYWGAFSRQVILPVEVDPDRTEASMKQGILMIRIPKILREKKRSIEVKG